MACAVAVITLLAKYWAVVSGVCVSTSSASPLAV